MISNYINDNIKGLYKKYHTNGRLMIWCIYKNCLFYMYSDRINMYYYILLIYLFQYLLKKN